jgi:hypothetical protein
MAPLGHLPCMIPIAVTPKDLKAVPSAAQTSGHGTNIYDLRVEYKGKPDINVYYPNLCPRS